GAAGSLGGSSSLAGAAALSPRPALCSAAVGVWNQTRNQQLQTYCETLARGHAVLQIAPASAEEWSKSLVGTELQTDALLLMGQALVAQGKFQAAWDAFAQAQQLSGAVPSNLPALRASAVAAMHIGKFTESAVRYRVLGRQWRLLPARVWSHVLTDAALAVWRTGPETRSEARRYLSIAAREHQYRGALPMVEAAQAMLAAEAGTSLRELPDLSDTTLEAPVPNARALAPQLLPGEWDALEAVSAEHDDPARARASWQRYLDSASSKPHREWVTRRLTSLPGAN